MKKAAFGRLFLGAAFRGGSAGMGDWDIFK
jgi:hypothetical protein